MEKFKVVERGGEIFKINPETGETFLWVDGELDGLDGIWKRIRKSIKKSIKKKVTPLAKTAAAGVITYYGGGALVKTPLGQKLLGPKQQKKRKAKPIQYTPQTVFDQPAPRPAYYAPPPMLGGRNMALIGGLAVGGLVLALALRKK